MSGVTDVIDAQIDAYFARDLERFVACYAPDVVITNAAGEVLAEGHDAVRQTYGGLFENSPQLGGRIANRIVVGDLWLTTRRSKASTCQVGRPRFRQSPSTR